MINFSEFFNKTAILRVDYNVPISNDIVMNTKRIDATFKTINNLLENQCKIILISHFGDPKKNDFDKYSLEPVAKYLKSKFLELQFIKKNIFELTRSELDKNKITLLENIRFYPQEKANDRDFAKILSNLGDFYVNDAFACCHRNHASINAITEFLPSFKGFLVEEENSKLKNFLGNAVHPYAAIVGGAKISSKLSVLQALISKVDKILIAGAMANNFLKVQGYDIGNSLYEEDFINQAKEILLEAKDRNVEVILPIDFKVASNINDDQYFLKNLGDNLSEYSIFDIGPKTEQLFTNHIQKVKTILWNGPLGVFENQIFSEGTIKIAKFIAKESSERDLVSIVGGGESIQAIEANGLNDSFTHISTGGGAFLKWLEDGRLLNIDKLI